MLVFYTSPLFDASVLMVSFNLFGGGFKFFLASVLAWAIVSRVSVVGNNNAIDHALSH